jgi:hypothetical protein
MKHAKKVHTYVQHVIVYLCTFYSSTNIAIHPTQNGILLEEYGCESDNADNLGAQDDLPKAELKKIMNSK